MLLYLVFSFCFDSVAFLFLVMSLLLLLFSSSKNTFKLLVVSELFWIALYASSLLIAIVAGDIFFLSLTLFFLMFSAAELSIGVSTFFLQRSFFGSLSTNTSLGSRLFL